MNSFIKQWRLDCKLSQTEAAAILKMSAQRYNYIERKGSTLPHEALRMMANAWAETTERKAAEFYRKYHES
jgi:transcriptional regulator with XRE-family HTH domain